MTLHNCAYAPENLELAAAYEVPVHIVDDAIDFALTQASLEDGARYADLNPLIWNRIGSDVENWIINYNETVGDIAA